MDVSLDSKLVDELKPLDLVQKCLHPDFSGVGLHPSVAFFVVRIKIQTLVHLFPDFWPKVFRNSPANHAQVLLPSQIYQSLQFLFPR